MQKSAAQHSSYPGAVNPQAAPQSLEDRRNALNALFAEMWQDRLAHDPEFASTIGDKRYNDQLTDYSVNAIQLASRGREYLMRLGRSTQPA